MTLTATNTSNLSNTATSKATIATAPPVANAGGPYTGIEGVALTFNGSGSTDPQGEALTYAWNFGDNTTGTGVSPTHTYTAMGTYTVTLTVTDTSGLTGTATVKVIVPNGRVYDGQQPIAGAHVYLFAANTTRYGQASVSLLSAAATGSSDSVGAYVATGADGSFFWNGDYTCTAGAQVYLYALGGNAGAGTNSASGMLAVLGSCPAAGNFSSVPYVTVNEVSTIAAAYAMAGFATDATHVSSSGTALAQVGVVNAFANAANLASLFSGTALATTPAGNGTAPQGVVNTLADILVTCVETGSPGSNNCSTLFSNAMSGGSTGTIPTDTATAAINIAHNPAITFGALLGLDPTNLPFGPTMSGVTYDFTVGISFTGGGLGDPIAIGVDGSGNAWVANRYSTVSKFSSTGVALSPSTGFTGGGLNVPIAIAIDGSGNAWIVDDNGGIQAVSKFSSSGAALSPSTGYTGGGLSEAFSIAIDSSGNAWVTNYGGNSLSKFSSTGVALSPSTGYTGGGLSQPRSIAFDGSGNAWIANTVGYNVSEFSSSGAPISPSTGYIGGGLDEPWSIAIDSSGNAWVADWGGAVSKFSNAGAALSPSTGYTGGGLHEPGSIAIDGSGNAWIADLNVGDVSEFSSAGAVLSPSVGFLGGGFAGPEGIAIDGSGDVWVANADGGPQFNGSVTELIGAATPVITPICAGLPATPTANGSSNLGTRP